MARPERPTLRALLVERREHAMERAVKRELRDLSLAHIKFQPLPAQLRQDTVALDSAIEGFKKNLIVEALAEAIIVRGAEHTIVRSFDVRDWDMAGFGEYKGMMLLVLFGWAYPDDNQELNDGG